MLPVASIVTAKLCGLRLSANSPA